MTGVVSEQIRTTGVVGLCHFVWSLLDPRVEDDGKRTKNFVRTRSCTYREIFQLNREFILPVLNCKLHLISLMIRRVSSRRNRLLRVRLFGRNPAWIIQQSIFICRDGSLGNHSELNKLYPRVT
jgi:hypothetical protein